MKCRSLFSRKKNKKKYFKISSAEIFTQSVQHLEEPDEKGRQLLLVLCLLVIFEVCPFLVNICPQLYHGTVNCMGLQTSFFVWKGGGGGGDQGGGGLLG